MRQQKTMPQATRLVTADEFERFSEDHAYRIELVRGRLVRMSPVGPPHGLVVVRLIVLLSRYLEEHPVGVILPDVGFKLQSDPDTVRGPDLAFIGQERFPALYREGFIHGAPDLVIEVLSPDDTRRELRAKLDDYFRAGVPVVVVIDPRKKSVTIHRPPDAPVVVRGDDAVLEIGDPLPGLRCTLNELLK